MTFTDVAGFIGKCPLCLELRQHLFEKNTFAELHPAEYVSELTVIHVTPVVQPIGIHCVSFTFFSPPKNTANQTVGSA